MKRKKALFRRPFLAVTLFLSLCGCAGDHPLPELSPPSSLQENSVILNTGSMFGGTDPAASTYWALLQEFEASNSNVDIRDVSLSPDESWKASVVNDYLSGNEPDVCFFFTGEDAKAFVNANLVVDIDTIRASYPEYATNILQEALDMTVNPTDKRSYAVPVTGFYEGLFVNETLFKEKGIPLPTDWILLMNAVQRLNEENIIPFAIALGHVPHYLLDQLILAAGGIEDHKVNPRRIYEMPRSWEKGFRALRTLYLAGAFPENTSTIPEGETKQLFYSGKAAMMVEGNWIINQIPKEPTKDGYPVTQQDVCFMPFPALEDSKADGTEILAGYSSGFYISKKAWEDKDKQKLCVDFVLHMTCNESIQKFVQANVGLPAADVEVEIPPDQLSGLEQLRAASGMDSPCFDRMNAKARDALLDGAIKVAVGEMTPWRLLSDHIPLNTEK